MIIRSVPMLPEPMIATLVTMQIGQEMAPSEAARAPRSGQRKSITGL